MCVLQATYILFSAFQSRLHFFRPYGPIQLVADFLLNAVAILLSTTLYSKFPLLLNLLILFPAILLCVGITPAHQKAKRLAKPKHDVSAVIKTVPEPLLPKKAFVTVYRGSMMVITCAAILAVDFKIFPRRFAKVENWGTSLMDLGVGSFVFSSGLVSSRQVLKDHFAKKVASSLLVRMKGAMRNSLPLLVLGFVRLVMVKGSGYAEHVTEYGVHWNFFFTLGFLPPLLALLQSIPTGGLNPTGLYTLLSLGVGLGYQVVLESTGLQAYVLIGDRNKFGLLGMNKEGISSFAGYLAIFLSGMATGMYVLPSASATAAPNTVAPRNRLLKTLVTWSVVWVCLFAYTSEYWGLGVTVSRRLANLPYFLWVAAFNTVQLTSFYLIERFFFDGAKETAPGGNYAFAVPRVLDVVNRNGLAVFLLANLLTGLVNVSVNTLEVGRMGAMTVLVGYLFVLVAVALGLDYKDLSIKL